MWAPLYIPLVKGLNLSKEVQLGPDELAVALNVDFQVDGAIRGRPSRSAPLNFEYQVVPDLSHPTYFSDITFNSTGFTPQGLMRVRDAAGERAALGCRGRLFVKDATMWRDRGHFACTRVDRLANLKVHTSTIQRPVIGPDFAEARESSGDYLALLDGEGALQRYSPSDNDPNIFRYAGGSARCGNYTAAVSRASATAKLYIHIRNNGADTFTISEIAADAATWTDLGDAASISCSHDQTVFFVAYRTTTSNQYKVLRVNTSGTVTHTFTGTVSATLQGIWVDNGPLAANRVVVALGRQTSGAGASGNLTLKMLSADTLIDAAIDSTYTAPVLYTGSTYSWMRAVTVGVESSTRAWWAVEVEQDSGSDQRYDILIGTVNPTSASSASLVKRYYAGQNAHIYWSVAHQPITLGSRTYLTLVAASPNHVTANYKAGTWITLDLSNLQPIGPFTSPTLVARGGNYEAAVVHQPESAVALADSSGWTFASHNFTTFSTDITGNVTGADAFSGINRVTFSGPRATMAAGTTYFSGSVPHQMAGDQVCEVGFPFLAGRPSGGASQASGGSIPTGSYSAAAVWRYTDGAGQVHRSVPTLTSSFELTAGTQTITFVVANPQMTERPDGQVVIELYVSAANPASSDPLYLQQVVTPSGYGTTSVNITSGLVTNTDIIYTYGGTLANVPVPGDGGVAALGRRVWMASADVVYASKLLVHREGLAWNDEGALQANLPAGAGRIVALEALDDKLVVFCERGVYAIQDGGPDNTGVGADIATPVRLSDVGCAGPRSTVMTDHGVLFCSPLDGTDASRGGIWLLDRQLTLTERQYLGRALGDAFLGSWTPEVAYAPERQQVFVTTEKANGSSHGVAVLDLRPMKWALWDTRSATTGSLRSITCVGGVLWALNDEPAPFDGTPGTDADGVGDYPMVVATSHVASNGRDGLGWARVRSVRTLEADGSGAHTLTITANQDKSRALTSGGIVLAASSADTTWPTSRQAPEWRLPSQKCGTLQVQLSATPATARWAAIRLDVQPLPRTAPAKNRS